MITIQTERLILRPFTMDDVDESYAMEQDAEVNQYTHDGGVKQYDEVEKLIHTLIHVDYAENGFGRFAVELKETSEFIGFCGLKRLTESQEVDLGYRLKRSHWGQGLATEACRACIDFGFRTLGLDELCAFVLPANARSIRVLDKVGFVFQKEIDFEGETARKYVLEKGEIA